MSDEKVIFLLGSGISIPAKIPGTPEVSEAVLTGKGFCLHTDGVFRNNVMHEGHHRNAVVGVLEFLGLLKDVIDDYYSKKGWTHHSTNYEQLYYLARQLADAANDEIDNPGVWALARELEPFVSGIRNRYDLDHYYNPSLFIDRACHYISDVAESCLRVEPTQTGHLRFLLDAAEDTSFRGIEVFTLNHDLLIEKLLATAKTTWQDGFGPEENGVRYWDTCTDDLNAARLSFWKLHGSVNWHIYRPKGSSWQDERLGFRTEPIASRPTAQEGESLERPRTRPLVLCGTFNKILEYPHGIFGDLHFRLRRELGENTNLVICGYGFGDKGINTYITNWVYENFPPRIVVVHPNPTKLRAGARGAIANKWEAWQAEGVLKVIPKRVEDLSWTELRANLVNH